MLTHPDMNALNILDCDNQRCRLCLNEGEDLIFIFDPKGYRGYRLWEVIKELLQVEVSKEDGLPGTICERCYSKVKEYKEFKTLCIRAKITFLTIIASRGMLSDLAPKLLPQLSKAILDGPSSQASSKDSNNVEVVQIAEDGTPVVSKNKDPVQEVTIIKREEGKGHQEKSKSCERSEEEDSRLSDEVTVVDISGPGTPKVPPDDKSLDDIPLSKRLKLVGDGRGVRGKKPALVKETVNEVIILSESDYNDDQVDDMVVESVSAGIDSKDQTEIQATEARAQSIHATEHGVPLNSECVLPTGAKVSDSCLKRMPPLIVLVRKNDETVKESISPEKSPLRRRKQVFDTLRVDFDQKRYKKAVIVDMVPSFAPSTSLKARSIHAKEHGVPLHSECVLPTGAKVSDSCLGRKLPLIILERLNDETVKQSISPEKSLRERRKQAFNKLRDDFNKKRYKNHLNRDALECGTAEGRATGEVSGGGGNEKVQDAVKALMCLGNPSQGCNVSSTCDAEVQCTVQMKDFSCQRKRGRPRKKINLGEQEEETSEASQGPASKRPREDIDLGEQEEKTSEAVNLIVVPVAGNLDEVVESDTAEIDPSALDPLATLKEEPVDPLSDPLASPPQALGGIAGVVSGQMPTESDSTTTGANVSHTVQSETANSEAEFMFVSVDNLKKEECTETEVGARPEEDPFAMVCDDQEERRGAVILSDDGEGALVVNRANGDQDNELGAMTQCSTESIFKAVDNLKEEAPVMFEAVQPPEGHPLTVNPNDQENQNSPIRHDDWNAEAVDEDTMLSYGGSSDSVGEPVRPLPFVAGMDSSAAFSESSGHGSLLKGGCSNVVTVRAPATAGTSASSKDSHGEASSVRGLAPNYFQNLIEEVVRTSLDKNTESNEFVDARGKRKRKPPSDPSWSDTSDISDLSDEDGYIEALRMKRRASLRSSDIQVLAQLKKQPAGGVTSYMEDSGLGRPQAVTASEMLSQAASYSQLNGMMQMKTSIRGAVECWWESVMIQRKGIDTEAIAELSSLLIYTVYFSGRTGARGGTAAPGENQPPSDDKHEKQVPNDSPPVIPNSPAQSMPLDKALTPPDGVCTSTHTTRTVNRQVVDRGGPDSRTLECMLKEGSSSSSAPRSEGECSRAKKSGLCESWGAEVYKNERKIMWKKAEFLFFLLSQIPRNKVAGVGHLCRLCDKKFKALKEVYVHTIEDHFGEDNFVRANISRRFSEGQSLLNVPVERLGWEMNVLRKILTRGKPMPGLININRDKDCVTNAKTFPSNQSKPTDGDDAQRRGFVRCVWCSEPFYGLEGLLQHLKKFHSSLESQWWMKSQSAEKNALPQPCSLREDRLLNAEALATLHSTVPCRQQHCSEQPWSSRQLHPQHAGGHPLGAQPSSTPQRTNANRSGMDESGSMQRMSLPYANSLHSIAQLASGQDAMKSNAQFPGMYLGTCTGSLGMQWKSQQQTSYVQMNRQPGMPQANVPQSGMQQVPQLTQLHASSSQAIFQQPNAQPPHLDSTASSLTLPSNQWSSMQQLMIQSSTQGWSKQLPSGSQPSVPTSVSHQSGVANASAPQPCDVRQGQQIDAAANKEVRSRKEVVSEPTEKPGHYRCKYCPEYFSYKRDFWSHRQVFHNSFPKNKQWLRKRDRVCDSEKVIKQTEQVVEKEVLSSPRNVFACSRGDVPCAEPSSRDSGHGAETSAAGLGERQGGGENISNSFEVGVRGVDSVVEERDDTRLGQQSGVGGNVLVGKPSVGGMDVAGDNCVQNVPSHSVPSPSTAIPPSVSLPNKSVVRVRCHICKEIFPALDDALTHFVKEHEGEKLVQNVELKEVEIVGNFKCSLCNANFASFGEMRMHFVKIHAVEVFTRT